MNTYFTFHERGDDRNKCNDRRGKSGKETVKGNKCTDRHSFRENPKGTYADDQNTEYLDQTTGSNGQAPIDKHRTK